MNIERLQEAFRYASEKHALQKRKGTDVPYIVHPMAVTAIVLEQGGTQDEAVAALLHDVVEDQGGAPMLEEIRNKFGDGVAQIVKDCSDAFMQPKPPWRERKEEHIQHLRNASRSVLLVTAADKLHNARTILADYREAGETLWGRFRGGKEGTLWYYRTIVDTLRNNASNSLIEELDRVVSELERLVSQNSQSPDSGLPESTQKLPRS